KSQQRCPRTITLDGYAASHRAVRELKADGSLPANTKLRSSKYLNNLIEQDHRGVKQRIAVMLGFKDFRNAAITIAGIELMHRIRKRQFGLGRLGVQGRAAPARLIADEHPRTRITMATTRDWGARADTDRA